MTHPSIAVVLLSGGLDSTVLLHHVARELQCPEIHALSFNYGQRHSRELANAAFQARITGIADHRRISTDIGRDRTHPRCHRFEQTDRRALRIGRQREHVELGIEPRDVAFEPPEMNVLADTQPLGLRREITAQRTFADQHNRAIDALAARQRDAIDQHRLVFDRFEPRDSTHHKRLRCNTEPLADLTRTDPRTEQIEVDAVGDDREFTTGKTARLQHVG